MAINDDPFADHDALVDWMRSRGVVHYKRGDVEILLGPEPRKPAPPMDVSQAVQDARDAEQNGREPTDEEILFMASHGLPPGVG